MEHNLQNKHYNFKKRLKSFDLSNLYEINKLIKLLFVISTTLEN